MVQTTPHPANNTESALSMLPLPLALSTIPSGRAGEQEILLRSPPSSPRDDYHSYSSPTSNTNSSGNKEHGGGGGKEKQMTEAVDFLAPADSMKALFRLPYNTQGVSVALHKFRGTLIVDGALDELYPGSAGQSRDERGERRQNGHQQQQYQQQHQDQQHQGTTAGMAPSHEQQRQQEQQEGDRGSGKGNTSTKNDMGGMHFLAATAGKAPSNNNNKGALLVPASFTAPPPPFHLPPLPREYPHLLHFQMHELSMTMGAELRVFR